MRLDNFDDEDFVKISFATIEPRGANDKVNGGIRFRKMSSSLVESFKLS